MQSNSTFSKVAHKPKMAYKTEQDGYGKGKKKDPVWKSNQRNAPKRNWSTEA